MIGIPENYKIINAEAALEDHNSIFWHYKNLIELRRSEDLLITGRYEDIDLENEKVYAYKRAGENEELVVISNFYGDIVEFDVSGLDVEHAAMLISNYKTSPEFKDEKIVLKPYESVMFKK